MAPPKTTTLAAGPYRSATLSLPRTRHRRRGWVLVLGALALSVGATARRRPAPRPQAAPVAAVAREAPLVLRDLRGLRPLTGATRIALVRNGPETPAVVAEMPDGSRRLLGPITANVPERGVMALRAVATPYDCMSSKVSLNIDYCAQLAYSLEDDGVYLGNCHADETAVTCRESFGSDIDTQGWTVTGASVAAGRRWFCVHAREGVARCFVAVSSSDERSWEMDPASIRGTEFRPPVAVRRVVLRGEHGCAYTASGDVYCADVNDREPRFTLTAHIEGLDRFWLAPTRASFCARDREGKVLCAGRWRATRDEPSEAFDGSEHPPAPHEALREVPALRGADDLLWRDARSGCARVTGGRVACWGWDPLGLIADGSALWRSVPARVAGVRGASQVAAGDAHACAVRRGEPLVCWGSNDRGQLGDGSTVSRGTARVVALAGDTVEVVAGPAHTCARTRSGDVWCWGVGAHGELGHGLASSERSPVRVRDLHDAVELSAGATHTCARTVSGDVRCWGRFEHAWPGAPAVHGALHPLRVALPGAAVRVRSFGDVACAELARGGARCWGASGEPVGEPYLRNAYVEADFAFPRPSLGGFASSWESGEMRLLERAARLGEALADVVPDGYPGAAPETVRLMATRAMRCAVLRDGSVWCAGDEATGDGRWERVSRRPARAYGITDATAVAVGTGFACALTARAEVWCWGANYVGQLGDGRSPLTETPTLALEEAR